MALLDVTNDDTGEVLLKRVALDRTVRRDMSDQMLDFYNVVAEALAKSFIAGQHAERYGDGDIPQVDFRDATQSLMRCSIQHLAKCIAAEKS